MSDDGLRTLLDAIDVRLSLFDRDDRLVYMNASALRGLETLEIDRTRLIGRHRHDLNRLLFDHGFIDRRQLDRLDGRDPQVDIEIAGRRWMTIRRFALADGGLAVVSSDVTEVRRAAQSVADEQRLFAIGTLVAGIAQEVNTPLGVAVTAASFLSDVIARARSSPVDADRGADRIARSLDEIARVAALVRANLERSAARVQDLRLLASDFTEDVRQPISICRHIADVVFALTPEANHRGHAILVDCPHDAEVRSFPAALSQVLTNLIVNGLRHAFGDRRSGTVLVTATVEGSLLRIVVGDDGVGVAPEDRRRMFLPYVTTRRDAGGRGLGLSIVHTLVTLRLGGTIETEGAPGEGLRQIVTVPIA